MVGDHPLVPDYGGACLSNVVPALLEPGDTAPSWLPAAAAQADQVVLLLLDGLGWEQLEQRRSLAPTLSAMEGADILTVAPSTTATALTSLSTGTPPGEHGVVGYRVLEQGDVLNVLRWSTPSGDARSRIDPRSVQSEASFAGQRPPVVTKAEFVETGFTRAHLDRVRFTGYRVTSTLVTEVRRLTAAGEPFVYAYYDGIDKVSHEYGLREHYDAELAFADRLVADLLDVLPPGAALVVTADHGQVDVGDNIVAPAPEVLAHVRQQSGEGRFRWLHAVPGHEHALAEAARACHGDQAWVRTLAEVEMEGWFGPVIRPAARARLGDVALVAHEDVSFSDPADTGVFELVGRHGSLTAAEMRVPLLAAVAGASG
ncbi:MAG: alkaline phosphatase family protein [Acidimicrobiales bacterium]|nr:alkaline phosphatase family protein [Acidimicrobiales bacterium]MCB9373627.1 alkaline phosphatase family protein [Microthrixaceae bacterium]